MADDIYLSPEEQDEKAKKWVKDNGPSIAIGILLGFAGIYGYNAYKENQLTKAQQGALAFSEVMEISASSDLADVSLKVDEIKDKYAGTPYAAKAALLKAKQLVSTDMESALTELDWALENASEEVVWHTANIRKAKVLLAQGKVDQAIQIAEGQQEKGFDSHYNEILGDAYSSKQDAEAAAKHYQKAIDSLSQSSAGYQRVLTMKLSRVAPSSDSQSSE